MADVADCWTRIQTLFEEALARPDDERSAWLRRACGDNPALYNEVEALLDGDAHQHTLFDGRAADLLAPSDFDAAFAFSRLGERVGPWELVERIGEGGMGAVYRADRADGAFEQTAALKLVKPGMDSEAVLARFRAERQILARLQHPGIARLLDGGLTEAERPYFAMEYVDGEPITDYCDARRLGVEARLRLFARVCEAVQYAHRALVVHRDLKPSNILVVEGEDGAARPVLLDFGIARLLEDDADAVLTRTGQRVLTPAYAAPEQIRGEAPTTTTDVYALGGLLYRLLTGARSVDPEGKSPMEVERAVLSETPRRPSAVVAPAAAQARSLSEAALARQLRGDLDTICLTALEKEPERRYGSAAELLADVQRHLGGLPIEARPATRAYRTRLFVRRHRVGIAAAAASVAVIGLVAALAFARVSAERDRAEDALTRSEAVSGFLGDLLSAASPRQNQGREVTVRELLAQAVEDIDALNDRPTVQADVLDVLGTTLYQINDYPAAAALQRRALALRRRLPGTPDSVLIDAYNRLGMSLRNGSLPDSAIAVFEEALAITRARLGSDDPWNVILLNNLTGPYTRIGRHDRAEATAREVVDFDDRTLPPDHVDRSFGLNNLATTLTQEGRFEEAEPLLRETVRLLRIEDDDYLLSYGVANLGWMLTEAGRPDEALPLAREAVDLRLGVLGPEERFTAEAFKFAADALAARGGPGDYAEADSLYRRSLDVIEATAGPDHFAYAYSLFGLGQLALARGRPAEAVREFSRALDFREANATDAPRELARTHLAIGDALAALGDPEAAAHYREAHTLAATTLREGDMVRSHAAALHGLVSGDASLYRTSVGALAERVGARHPATEAVCARGRACGVSAPACG